MGTIFTKGVYGVQFQSEPRLGIYHRLIANQAAIFLNLFILFIHHTVSCLQTNLLLNIYYILFYLHSFSYSVRRDTFVMMYSKAPRCHASPTLVY